MTTVRRTKWHPPPPPTPRILHLPRRSNRHKNPNRNATTLKMCPTRKSSSAPVKGKLERLFDEERMFIPPVVLLNSGIGERGRREITVEEAAMAEEEQWRFQAEMLRAECNFLRMEREIAVKKLKRERGLLQSSLKSAVHTLLSGKKKIRDGKSVNLVPIEEEIEKLAMKLVELQRSSNVKHSRHNSSGSSSSNFDKQAFLLRKELEKIGEMGNGDSAKEEIMSSNFSSEMERDGRFDGFGLRSRRKSNRFADVETLKRKMEGLSKGKLLKRMEEEYGSMLAPSASGSMPNSASTSKRYDLPELSSFSVRLPSQETKSGEPKTCSGHCKTIVRRIMEQVRAETEQWSQMQEMLGQVREEMEELQVSRDFWEKRALESSSKIDTLNSEVGEWKQKAHSLESNENQLQEQVKELQQELEKMSMERSISESEVKKGRKELVSMSLGAQLAKEKRALTCRGKNGLTSEYRDIKVADQSDDKKTPQKNSSKILSSTRHPFQDIGNLSPLMRQNSRRYIHPLHSPRDS